MIAKKLRKGSHIRVIDPARSLGIVSEECRQIARQRLNDLGLTVSFGRHAEETDEFCSSSAQSRLEDLHEAFADKTVDGILTVIGGFNSVEILSGIDYRLIAENPKILCGFSDITALANAIHAKTGLVTYSGPHFSTFGMQKGLEYTIDYFRKCLFSEEPFELSAALEWSDDPWYRDQENRTFIKNDGYWEIASGQAEGRLIGGNLGTFVLLNGTPYRPPFAKDTVLFVEDTGDVGIAGFTRCFQALLQQPDFANVKAVLIGRFQKKSAVTREQLEFMVERFRPYLKGKPVIANLDFGHSTPLLTIPVGGTAEIDGGKIRFSVR